MGGVVPGATLEQMSELAQVRTARVVAGGPDDRRATSAQRTPAADGQGSVSLHEGARTAFLPEDSRCHSRRFLLLSAAFSTIEDSVLGRVDEFSSLG